MAGNSVGTAYLTLVPKLDKGGLSSIETSMASTGKLGGNAFSGAFGVALGGLKKAAAVGTAAIAGTVAATGAVAGAFSKAVDSVASYGDNVDKMSQKIGISNQAYQEWAYVMERSGTSVDILQSGMKTLSTQAQAGAEEFQKLGIAQDEVASLSKEELFNKVVDSLAGMEDGTERTALATKLLGRSATELAPLLNQGTDAIKEQREMAEKYGLVMSDDAVKASADFKDSLTTLQGTMTGAKNRMIAEFLPAVTQVSDGLALVFTGDVTQGMELINEGINSLIEGITAALPTFLENGGKIVESLLQGLADNMPTIVEGMSSLLQTVIDSIPTFLPIILLAAFNLFMGIVQAVPQITGSLLGAVGSLITSGISSLGGYVGPMLARAGDLFMSIASAVPTVLTALNNKLSELIRAGVDKVKSFVGDMTSAGGDLIRGIVEGLSPSAVVEKIKDICGQAVDAVKRHFGIASPSKVMRELFGYVGDGMALGLDDSDGEVRRSMQGLIDSAYGVAASYETGATGASRGRMATNADVVRAITSLHDDLAYIIRNNTDNGLTPRQFGRAVRQYA